MTAMPRGSPNVDWYSRTSWEVFVERNLEALLGLMDELKLIASSIYPFNQRGQTTRIIGTERTIIKISSGNPMRQ